MQTTMKLSLTANDEEQQRLHSYGKIMRHEIYKVAGVFLREKRIFPFPYRYISNQIAWDCKQIVVEQAAILYQKRMCNAKASINYSSIWSANACMIQTDGFLVFYLKKDRNKPAFKVHFRLNDDQFRIITKGNVMRIIIKENGESLFAYIHLTVNAPIQQDNFIAELKKQMLPL